MVSVVCGHSICYACTLPSAHDDAASTSSDSSDDEPPRCPVCSVPLAGFVKNFDLISQIAPPPPPDVPDLRAVLSNDLVVDATSVSFMRSPANEVGRGASSVVYRGVYMRKPVAVKCIRTMSDTFATEDRLRRELKNASTLKNPHIVEFRAAAWDYEAGPNSPKNVLLVTELMNGGNLRESLNLLLSQRSVNKLGDSGNGFPGMGGLAVESFLHVALQIARGIEYLHHKGLAHRDIKSANILLTDRLTASSNRFEKTVRAKIADFGLSKYIDKATGGGTIMQSIMEPGRLEATYAYLAPEAFGGDKTNVIRRSDSEDDDDGRGDMAKKRDIYALGVLFWEILTAQIPWSGVSLPDVYVRVCVRSDRPGPALDDARVSKSVRRLVERCWAQDPAKRPSARSIVAKLEKLSVKFGIAEENGGAAEAVSVVSGAANGAGSAAGADTVPDVQSEPIREQRDVPSQRDPSDSVRSYQKMPSASTVYTTANDSKTHSTGFEAGDQRDFDRSVDDLPPQFDDNTWIHDGDSSSRGHNNSHRMSLRPVGSIHVTPGNSNASQSHSQHHDGPFSGETSSLNRRHARSRHQLDFADGEHQHSRSHLGVQQQQIGATVNASSGNHLKSNSTAVAATAAAIAAAKDRERRRDDARAARAAAARAQQRVQNPPVVDTSFQSLPNAMAAWQRGVSKDRMDARANAAAVGGMFYDSDEEAQGFDPERAAAEEAMAQPDIAPPTNSYPRQDSHSRHALNPTIRSASTGRVGRPKSPVTPRVRRPMSPSGSRVFSPTSSRNKPAPEEDISNSRSHVTRTIEPSTSGSKKSLARGGRLGRMLSATKQQPARPMTPVVQAPQRSKGLVASASAAPTVGGSGTKRPFIRRMRSNETGRRMARSSSTTGVENQRTNLSQASNQHSSSAALDVQSREDDDAEYTVMQIGAVHKEDYELTVKQQDKSGLLRLFSQRMPSLRLAALALAALRNPKHRLDEEILRHSCAILHRLTVPSRTAQKSGAEDVSMKGQLSIRRYLKSSQAIEALLQALHPPQLRHPTTLSYGLLAVGNLTAWDLEAHKQFRNAHGVLQITNVMKTHSKNGGVQEKGCYALACVGASYPVKTKTIFEQAGALDVVISALSEVKKDAPNEAVMKQACAALGAMCSSSPSNAQYAGRKDALAYLVSAFDRFRAVSKTDGGKRSEMRLVCKAFMDLLCNTENKKLAGSKGGSTMIIRAMRIFRLDSEFIERGLTMLSEFCTHKSNGTQIVQASGVDDIVASMERFPLSVNMQREGTRVLTLLMMAAGDQARRRVVHVNGAEVVVSALERFGAVGENNVGVVVETCRTLSMLFKMESSVEGEKLGKRMKKLGCDRIIKKAIVAHRQNEAVQEKGKEALKALGSIRGLSGWGLFRKR